MSLNPENPRATSLQSVSLPGSSGTPSGPAEQPSQQQKPDPNSNPAVRFAFNVETISPETATRPTPKDGTLSTPNNEMGYVSQSLRDAHVQERRMSIFTFEPYSLPPSRVGSSVWSHSMAFPGGPICEKFSISKSGLFRNDMFCDWNL